jgi:hypothetical protein
MIVSTQRPAIEKVASFSRPFRITEGQRYFVEGVEVFFCGTSDGFTPHAELRDVRVAGFSDVPGDNRAADGRTAECAGAVLVRGARIPEDIDLVRASGFDPHIQCLTVIEAIECVDACPDQVFFRRTGASSVYVDII